MSKFGPPAADDEANNDIRIWSYIYNFSAMPSKEEYYLYTYIRNLKQLDRTYITALKNMIPMNQNINMSK